MSGVRRVCVLPGTRKTTTAAATSAKYARAAVDVDAVLDGRRPNMVFRSQTVVGDTSSSRAATSPRTIGRRDGCGRHNCHLLSSRCHVVTVVVLRATHGRGRKGVREEHEKIYGSRDGAVRRRRMLR